MEKGEWKIKGIRGKQMEWLSADSVSNYNMQSLAI